MAVAGGGRHAAQAVARHSMKINVFLFFLRPSSSTALQVGPGLMTFYTFFSMFFSCFSSIFFDFQHDSHLKSPLA